MSSKENSTSLRTPLNPPTANQNLIIILPYTPHRRRLHHYIRRCLLPTAAILLLAATVYLLYPSDPTIQLTRLKLKHAKIETAGKLRLDLSFSLTVKVRNPDFFSLSYDSLVVGVGYRGREIGILRSEGGGAIVKARDVSYVDAVVDVDGFEIVHDVFYFIEDLANGAIPFDTTSSVRGRLGVFFFHVPIKGRVSCEVYVNVRNQTVVRQDCYPE